MEVNSKGGPENYKRNRKKSSTFEYLWHDRILDAQTTLHFQSEKDLSGN